MALEVGAIVEGKITGLTKFGAFVELPEKQVGMVHISEVSNQFVKEIGDFLEKGQQVKVKVLKIDDDGKISLSIKKANPEAEGDQKPREKKPYNKDGKDFKDKKDWNKDGGDRPQYKKRERSKPNVWEGQKKNEKPAEEMSFEEMMAKFKSDSDAKLSDLKHATESKHGGFSRRGGNKRYN